MRIFLQVLALIVVSTSIAHASGAAIPTQTRPVEAPVQDPQLLAQGLVGAYSLEASADREFCQGPFGGGIVFKIENNQLTLENHTRGVMNEHFAIKAATTETVDEFDYVNEFDKRRTRGLRVDGVSANRFVFEEALTYEQFDGLFWSSSRSYSYADVQSNGGQLSISRFSNPTAYYADYQGHVVERESITCVFSRK